MLWIRIYLDKFPGLMHLMAASLRKHFHRGRINLGWIYRIYRITRSDCAQQLYIVVMSRTQLSKVLETLLLLLLLVLLSIGLQTQSGSLYDACVTAKLPYLLNVAYMHTPLQFGRSWIGFTHTALLLLPECFDCITIWTAIYVRWNWCRMRYHRLVCVYFVKVV
jgi:hypothetical protein